MGKNAFFAVILILVGLFAIKWNALKSTLVDRQLSQPKMSVLLTGFAEEASSFLDKSSDPRSVSDKISSCENGYESSLFGSKVLIATTGMAKVKTTACLMDILHVYGARVKEVIFVGIAGITPMKGGLLDKDGNLRNSEAAMLGDVCINSLAYDFDLQYYTSDSENQDFPNPIFWPQTNDFSAAFTRGDRTLAEELVLASKKVKWPTVPPGVRDVNILYHAKSRQPKVWGVKECLEISGDLFWHDSKADERARVMAADYLNKVYGGSISPDGILIVTSMEAVATGAVVDMWNESRNNDISFAYVRSASNFDHVYFNPDGTPAANGKTSILELRPVDGASYAVDTASLPVLKMFELRRNQDGN